MQQNAKNIVSFLVIIIILLLVGWWGYYHFENNSKKSTHATHHKTLSAPTYITLKKYNVPLIVSTYGYTISPKSVTVRTSTSGIIKSIHFTSGQIVKKGQLLFTIQASDVTQQLNYLKPKLLEAKINYDTNLAVNKQTPGAVAKQQLLALKTTYDQYQTQYNHLYSQSHIKAAINGRISDTNLAVGDLVSANDNLAYISTKSLIQLSYHLPSKWAPKAKLFQHVTFINNQKQSYDGIVAYISPMLDANNQGVNMRADMQPSKQLTANQFGQIIQTINTKQMVLAIPQTLVQTDAKGYFVVIVTNHKIANKYFTPGRVTKSGLITVAAGLKAGDKILNNPGMYAAGQKI